MAGRTGREEKSNSSLLHLISLFSQQGQELRKPPSKGFHTGSAQKPEDLTSSKPSQMCWEEQMGSEEEEEEEQREGSAETALPCTAPARTYRSWENKPELLLAGCAVPRALPGQKAQGWGEEMPRAAGMAEAGTALTGNPSASLLRNARHPRDPCNKPGWELPCWQQLPATLRPRRQAEPPFLSWGVPGKTHPACRAPPPRGPCCAGSA